MKEQKFHQIPELFFDFMSLFHQKLGPAFHKQEDCFKCNKNQNKALFIIGRENKITPSQLGKRLDLRKGSLTTLLDSLENMHLVKRKTDPNDRRKTLIYLTPDGKNYLAKMNQKLYNDLSNLFNKLPEQELEDFINSLYQIVNTMKKI